MTKKEKLVVNRKAQNKNDPTILEVKGIIPFKFLILFLVVIGLVNVFNWIYTYWAYIEPAAWISSIGFYFRKQIFEVLFNK